MIKLLSKTKIQYIKIKFFILLFKLINNFYTCYRLKNVKYETFKPIKIDTELIQFYDNLIRVQNTHFFIYEVHFLNIVVKLNQNFRFKFIHNLMLYYTE